MAKTLRTSGDYTIKAGDGYDSGSGTNSITLDSLNVTVNGNLTVGGTSSTISTTNTVIEDNIIELQTGISASTNDSGIIIERGSTGNNACIIWDESTDTFKLGTTTATGTDKSGGITVTAGALEVAAFTATTITATSFVTTGTAITIADNLISTGASNADIKIVPHGTGGIRIPDDIQLHFGNEAGGFGDLQIWHDAGAHSYIRDQGSGDIRIYGTGVDIRSNANDRSIARFDDTGMTVENLTIQDNTISSASNGDIELLPSGTGKVVINNLSIDGELGDITSDSSNMDITVTPHGTGDFRVDGHVGLKVQAGDAAADGDHAHIYAKDDTSSAEVYVRDEAGNVTKLSPHNREGEWEYFSRNVNTGKVVRINMEEMIKDIEELTGKTYIKGE